MNKQSSRLKGYFYPFGLIMLFGVILTFILIVILVWLTGYNVLSDPIPDKRLDGIIKIVGVAVSVTGFVSIIIAVIQSKESIQRDLRESSIELFRELRSEKFIDARRRAWIVKDKWYEQENYKQALIVYNFSDRGETKNEELDGDMKAVYQLMEFYLMVSVYEGNEHTLKALRYFYYGWWRHFLYDFADAVESNTKTNDLLKHDNVTYLQDISYTRTLQRLDKLCGLQNIARDTVLHLDGG